MRRRQVLTASSTLGAIVLAGCSGTPVGPNSVDRTTLRLRDPAIATKEAVTLLERLSVSKQRLVRNAISDGSITVHGYDPLPLVRDYVLVDGTYYRLTTERGNSRTEQPVLDTNRTSNTTGAVSLQRYDGHAKDVVYRAMPDGVVILHNGTRGREDLLPQPPHRRVTWRNETYDLAVEDRMVNLRSYTVMAQAVADDEEAFADVLRDQAVSVTLDPTALSEETRDILSQAIADEYVEESPYTDAYLRLLDTIRSGERTDAEWPTYVVTYDGSVYTAEIRRVTGG